MEVRAFYSTKEDIVDCLCTVNSNKNRGILERFKPQCKFFKEVMSTVFPLSNPRCRSNLQPTRYSFTEHESHREPSVEFKQPGSSCWTYAQDWAQTAVDRSENTPLPEYNPVYETEPPTDHISYALGVALGRCKADGTGILDPTTDDLSNTLPHGILFLNGSLLDSDLDGDSLGHPASKILHNKWKEYGHHIKRRRTEYLRDYFRERFLVMFISKCMKGNRYIGHCLPRRRLLSFGSIFIEWIPIRWKDWKPLSSERRREPQRTYKNSV